MAVSGVMSTLSTKFGGFYPLWREKAGNENFSREFPHLWVAGVPPQNLVMKVFPQFFGVATPAEPRGEKKLFFVQILGGEKLLKFVEKCRSNIFRRPERG